MLHRIISIGFSFIFIPVSLGILFKLRKAKAVSIAFLLLYFVYLIFGRKASAGLSILGEVISFASMGIAALFLYGFSDMVDAEKNDSLKKMQEVETEYKEIEDKNNEIRINNEILENKVSEIAQLYQISKRMSEVLEFEEILKILCEILGSLRFTNCELIIMQPTKEKNEILKIYQLPNPDAKYQPGYIDAVLDFVSTDKTPILIDSPQDPLRDKLYLKEDLSTFFAQPLMMRDKLEGVLILENLQPIDFKKVLIIGGQLAMQLERVRLYELVQQLAITDGLTGVFSRRHLMERFDEELKRSIRFNTKLAYLMVDIDKFKDYNDKYGHLVGDVILKEIAAIFRNSLRQLDLTGRYGGEEFSIILPETNKESASAVGERLKDAVSGHIFKAYDEIVRVTISIGVAVFPDDAEDLQQLLDKADQALYKAKQSGRNRVCCFRKD